MFSVLLVASITYLVWNPDGLDFSNKIECASSTNEVVFKKSINVGHVSEWRSHDFHGVTYKWRLIEIDASKNRYALEISIFGSPDHQLEKDKFRSLIQRDIYNAYGIEATISKFKIGDKYLW